MSKDGVQEMKSLVFLITFSYYKELELNLMSYGKVIAANYYLAFSAWLCPWYVAYFTPIFFKACNEAFAISSS